MNSRITICLSYSAIEIELSCEKNTDPDQLVLTENHPIWLYVIFFNF